jgi:hypothetical protein
MGFYEDERIRAKNRVHNDAYQEYNSLMSQGYTDADITHICTLALESSNKNRNDIFLTVLKIVGRSNDEGSNTNS